MHQVASAGVAPRPPAEYMPVLRKQLKPETQSEDEIREAFDAICQAMAQLTSAQPPNTVD